jgi:hypothetical protein
MLFNFGNLIINNLKKRMSILRLSWFFIGIDKLKSSAALFDKNSVFEMQSIIS